MSRYRDKLQIVADILAIVNTRARKTQIMYQANLSYKLLVRYLAEIIEAGLVTFENEEFYTLTSKGKKFLQRHEKYSRLCRILEQRLNHSSIEKAALEKMCK